MSNTSELGSIVTVKVDPETNGGYDTAPAIVTAVNEDGTRRIRVFAGVPGGAESFRDYVDDNGEPHDYEADQNVDQAADTEQAPAPAPQSSPAPGALDVGTAVLAPAAVP